MFYQSVVASVLFFSVRGAVSELATQTVCGEEVTERTAVYHTVDNPEYPLCHMSDRQQGSFFKRLRQLY